jgi:signal transduction histidine kinase
MAGPKASTVRRIAWSIGLGSLALHVGALVILYLDRHAVVPSDATRWSYSTAIDAASSTAVVLIGIVLASRQPRNFIGWLFLVAGLGLALGNFTTAYGLYALKANPGSLPAGRALAWVGNWVWTIPVTLLVYLLLLFPTGRLLSRRWRPVARAIGVFMGLLTVGAMTFALANWSNPFGPNQRNTGLAAIAQIPFLVAIVALPAALLASFGAVALRFKRSRGEERLQMKWFVTAAALVAVTFSINILVQSGAVQLASDVALLFLWAAIGIAVLKYRLYEIDFVISKTVVFGTLAAFITLVYVALVVGVGTAVGNRHSPLLTAIAAAVVALAFQPMRTRAQRLANRIIYGKRATPYEVLSEFAERIASTYSSVDVLPRMARMIAAGTGADRTVVWLRVGNELHAEASSNGLPETSVLPVVGNELPLTVAGETAVPVTHQGELLGAISISMPPNEPLSPAGERLVADVASQAGLVLSNVRLIEELRASRQRLVAAQDAERRKLERNLHDGAQQQLVALAVKQRLAAALVTKDPGKAAEMLEALQEETAGALENLRDLARGIYPPLLADQGLAAALTSQARKATVPVEVDADGIGRYPQDAEAAVYFCCLEALQNVAKYAKATRVHVRLSAHDGELSFEVTDDGQGFDAARTPLGSGMQNMADRLAALDGLLEVRSRPGEGATVTGRLPVPPTGSLRPPDVNVSDRPS